MTNWRGAWVDPSRPLEGILVTQDSNVAGFMQVYMFTYDADGNSTFFLTGGAFPEDFTEGVSLYTLKNGEEVLVGTCRATFEPDYPRITMRFYSDTATGHPFRGPIREPVVSPSPGWATPVFKFSRVFGN